MVFAKFQHPFVSVFGVAVMSTLVIAAFAAITPPARAGDGTYGKSAPARADLVDTAVAAGQFKTLATALKAAGLVEILKSDGPFTVFAPTDDAFAKLPPGTVEDLLKPENKEKLVAVLTYHVVPGKAMAKDVTSMTSAKTVNGKDLALKAEGGKVMINNATVIKADIEATNGVIHVIDTVLLP